MKLFTLVFLGFLSLQLSAQTPPKYTVLETLFVPATYFVGDTVEMRLLILPTSQEDLFISEQLPETDWVDIKSVQVNPKLPQYEIINTFIPYVTGNRTLPGINLGTMTLGDLRVYTTSILEGTELSPPREQVLLPQTELMMVSLLSLVIFLPLFGWKTHRKIQTWIQSFLHKWNRLKPLRRFLKDLGRIRGQMFSLGSPEFYRQLQASLRDYLGARFDQDLESFTTGELDALVGEKMPAGPGRIILSFFRFADVVVYDSRVVPEDRQNEDIKLLESTLKALEENPDVVL